MDEPENAATPAGAVLEPQRAPAVELKGPELRRALGLVSWAWFFGSVWMTATAGAPFTRFAKILGATEFQFGLITAVPFLAQLLSLPASFVVEHTGQRKPIFFMGLYLNRLMWIPLALVPLAIVKIWGMQTAPTAVVVFLLLFFLMQSGQAIGSPGWWSWMADIVPDRFRGRYFSRRRQLGLISALPAALLVGWLMDRNKLITDSSMLTLCCCIFVVAALFGLVDIIMFHPVPNIPKPPQRGPGLLKAMRKPLRDREFMWFAGFVATMVFAVVIMNNFLTLYLMEKLHISNTGVQLMLIVVPGAAQLVFSPVFGRAADRMGKKPILILAALGLGPVGFGWCFLNEHMIWLGYVLAAVGAALWLGIDTANASLVLEMAGQGDDENEGGGAAYPAVNSIVINIAGCLSGLTAGLIAKFMRDWHWGTYSYYEVLFVLSALLRVLAVVIFLPHLHEHNARPTTETLRYMTSNFYNNVYAAITQPLKLVRAPGKKSIDTLSGGK